MHFRRLPAPGRLGKLDSLWQTGVLVGYKANAGEYMIVNHEGAYKTRTVRRAPVEDRWSKTDVEGIKYTPWQVRDPTSRTARGNAEDEVATRPSVHIDVDHGITIPDVPPDANDALPRRAYLAKAILEKFGATDGCPGCTVIMLGSSGVVHNDERRKRLEKEMKDDPEKKAKLKDIKRKRSEFVSKHVSASSAKANPEGDEPATAEATAGSSSRPGGEAAEHSSSNAKRDREDNEVVGGTRARTQRDDKRDRDEEDEPLEHKREKTKDEERRRAAKRLSRTAEDEPDAAKKQLRSTDDREMFLMCAEDDRDQGLNDYSKSSRMRDQLGRLGRRRRGAS